MKFNQMVGVNDDIHLLERRKAEIEDHCSEAN